MTETASGASCFLLLFYCGILTGLGSVFSEGLYLRFRGRLVRTLLDVLLLLFGSAVLVGGLLLSNGGRLRFYLLIAFGAGIWLVQLCFLPFFTRISQKKRK